MVKVTRPLNVDIQLAVLSDFEELADGLEVFEYSHPAQPNQNWKYCIYEGKVVGVNYQD